MAVVYELSGERKRGREGERRRGRRRGHVGVEEEERGKGEGGTRGKRKRRKINMIQELHPLTIHTLPELQDDS